MPSVDLRLGDCRDVLPLLASATIDVLITDPPYGIGIDNHGQARRNRTAIRGDEDMATGMAVLAWCKQHSLPTIFFASPRRPWPGEWRNLIIWDKGGGVGGGGDFKTCLKLTWELIQVARNGAINGGRDESVWRRPITPRDFRYHPCEKPVDLMERLVRTFTRPGQTVLDPFLGSGSTGVACFRLNRNFIGVEVDPDYFAVAERRIQEAETQLLLFE